MSAEIIVVGCIIGSTVFLLLVIAISCLIKYVYYLFDFIILFHIDTYLVHQLIRETLTN